MLRYLDDCVLSEISERAVSKKKEAIICINPHPTALKGESVIAVVGRLVTLHQ